MIERVRKMTRRSNKLWGKFNSIRNKGHGLPICDKPISDPSTSYVIDPLLPRHSRAQSPTIRYSSPTQKPLTPPPQTEPASPPRAASPSLPTHTSLPNTGPHSFPSRSQSGPRAPDRNPHATYTPFRYLRDVSIVLRTAGWAGKYHSGSGSRTRAAFGPTCTARRCSPYRRLAQSAGITARSGRCPRRSRRPGNAVSAREDQVGGWTTCLMNQ